MAELLRDAHPGLVVEIVPLSTEGDRRTDVPLSVIGGKGVFAKEVQSAVLDGRADIAVHSAKDLPALTPEGLVIAAVPERGDPRDALVGRRIDQLLPGDIVATGSARRRLQLAAIRPGVAFAELRGNMATRLAKADGFAAIVVAAAALQRLGLSDSITDILEPSLFVPQVGQGTLAVECRDDDDLAVALLGPLQHAPSRRVLDCERSFLVELGGDCSLPAGAHARILEDGTLEITGVLGANSVPSGQFGVIERDAVVGHDGEAMGRSLARDLRTRVEAPGA